MATGFVCIRLIFGIDQTTRNFENISGIEVGLAPRQPDLDSIKIMSEPLPHETLLRFRAMYDTDKTSLGIVRPSEVLDLTIEPAEREWKPEWESALSQFNLFPRTAKGVKNFRSSSAMCSGVKIQAADHTPP